MISLVCLAATILVSALGVQGSGEHHIVGGTRATSCEFPHIVFLYTKKNGNYFVCGGSILDERHVVTAGHCLHGDVTNVDVLLGSLDKSTMPTWIAAATFIKNSGYKSLRSTVVNDVAVLKLSKPIRFSACVKPIRMAVLGEKFVGDCRIAGWGRTGFNEPTSHKLMRADVPLMDKGTCESQIPIVLDQHVCAGSGRFLGKTTCKGDSGGPLTCTSAVDGADVLVGIVSYGWKCDTGLAVFTNVAYFNHWINAVVKKMT